MMNGISLGSERGTGLVESLIAVAIATIAITALVAALSTGSMAVQRNGDRVTAENLARMQMEEIKGQAYSSSGDYSTITAPDGYTISIAVSAIDGRDTGEMQEVTVTIGYDGDSVLLEAYKSNR